MRIAIVTAGSRGDVQPYVALGTALATHGHAVTVTTYPAFETLVTDHGLGFRALPVEVGDEMSGDDAEASTLPGVSLVRRVAGIRRLARRGRGLVEGILEGTWNACAEADAAVGSVYGFAVPQAAAALGIPYAFGVIYPLTPTRDFPMFMTPPGWRLPKALHRGTYRVARRLAWRFLGGPVRAWRKAHGMGSLGTRTWGRALHDAPVLYAVPTALVPRPDDWPAHHHLTGFWRLERPSTWQPPEDLVDFLDAGSPPVLLALGSITARDPDGFAERLDAARRRLGLRALLAGTGDAGPLPGDGTAFAIDAVPHDWLLPRCLAAVHHAGPGTSAATALAGLPSLTAPGPLDEPFWGRRLADAGAAPPPRAAEGWSEAALVDGLRRLRDDEAMQHAARRLGQQILADDGAARAAAWLDRVLAGGDPGAPP